VPRLLEPLARGCTTRLCAALCASAACAHADAATRACGAAPCALQPLPFHYIEIAVALFKYAGDAFGERRPRVIDLVENIRRRVACLLTSSTPRLRGRLVAAARGRPAEVPAMA
jgi:hypothetical protein